MWNTSSGGRRGLWLGVGVLCLLATARSASAQDAASIFTTLGRFASGFNAGSVFFGPAGFIHSDALKEGGELQEVGLVLNNPRLNISIGFDMLSGFTAREPSLDLRGSIVALPTVSAFHRETLPRIIPDVSMSGGIGIGIGLSRLQDVRATIPQSPQPDRAVKLGGSGYHVGASVGTSLGFGRAGIFISGSYRYTRFPSLEWTDDKTFVPPAGWPTSMDMWTGTVRVGLAIGARAQSAQK